MSTMWSGAEARGATRRWPRLRLAWPQIAALGAFLFWSIVTSPLAGADAVTYYAAGERLNAGHALYVISPGDRPIPALPEYGMSPLLSPPLIAVLFRPLALLPIDVALVLWTATQFAVVGATVALLARSRGAAATAILLSLGLGLALVGNVNTFMLAGAVVAWRCRHRPETGALVAVLAAVKLLPLALLGFLIAQRDHRHLMWFVAGTLIAGVVSLAGAGWEAHVAYLDVLRTAPPQPGALADITGVARLNTAIFVLGFVVASLLPSAASFRVAVVAMVFGAPGMGPAAATQLLAVESQAGLTMTQRLALWVLVGITVVPSVASILLAALTHWIV